MKAGLTIQEVQVALEQALAQLPQFPQTNPLHQQAVKLICPAGFRRVVELREDGRKKRRTASADNWSPEKGEIVISFERDNSVGLTQPAVALDLVTEPTSPRGYSTIGPQAANPSGTVQLRELLSALEIAETAPGRAFVALKWFRDDFLLKQGLLWAQDAEQRQALLGQAIKDGWVLTSKVANPRSPMYPTTTIRLNRQLQSSTTTAKLNRFRPVPILGEPLSATISSDRGKR